MAATESDGSTLHKEFCEFLLTVLRHEVLENGVKVRTCTPAWGTVIRSFLKDNSITTVPDPAGTDPLSQLSRQFHNSTPPRTLDPGLDLDTDEVQH